MENLKKIPHFAYCISYTDNKPSSILIGHVVFDNIKNINEFFRELGYTDELRKLGELPDEFIWGTYIRDDAAKTAQCLQSKITGHLIRHSERFRKEYGNEYVNAIGKCVSDKMDDCDICIDCPMHPGHLYS